MVYLSVVVICTLAVLLWKVSSHADPHHRFILSLLPMLDLEHTIGRPSDLANRALKATTHSRNAS